MGAVISALIAARVSSTQICIIDSTLIQPVAQVILSWIHAVSSTFFFGTFYLEDKVLLILELLCLTSLF